MEPVGCERVGARGIHVEELAQAVGASGCRGLEHVELRLGLEELRGARVVAAVQRLQQLRHQRSNRDRRRSLRTRPPVWQSGQ